MRILVLNGSPRPKGNTKQMIDAFREGAESAGHQVNVIDVCKKKIASCLACEYCHTKGNGVCVQKDDMKRLRQQIPLNLHMKRELSLTIQTVNQRQRKKLL